MAKKTVRMKYYAPEAKKVSLAGNFNNWKASLLKAKKDRSGNWTVAVSLTPGRYEYKFVVDGSWLNDPSCRENVGNNLGSTNSVLVVK